LGAKNRNARCLARQDVRRRGEELCSSREIPERIMAMLSEDFHVGLDREADLRATRTGTYGGLRWSAVTVREHSGHGPRSVAKTRRIRD